MNRLLGLFLWLSIVLAVPAQANQTTERLTLGIFPYYSSEKLVALHTPLKTYLSEQLNHPISMRSAPSFKDFAKRTNNAQYDLVITAPHLARIAEQKADYRCIAITGNVSYAAFVSLKDNGLKQISDLKGKTIALPPTRAIIHQLALETLRDAGLTPGKDVYLRVENSHNGAMLAALKQHADAAAFGLPTWRGASPEHKAKMEMFAHSKEIPGFAFLIHTRIPPTSSDRLKTALLGFPDTTEGQIYLQRTGLEGFIPATRNTLQSLDPYIDAMFSKQ